MQNERQNFRANCRIQRLCSPKKHMSSDTALPRAVFFFSRASQYIVCQKFAEQKQIQRRSATPSVWGGNIITGDEKSKLAESRWTQWPVGMRMAQDPVDGAKVTVAGPEYVRWSSPKMGICPKMEYVQESNVEVGGRVRDSSTRQNPLWQLLLETRNPCGECGKRLEIQTRENSGRVAVRDGEEREVVAAALRGERM